MNSKIENVVSICGFLLISMALSFLFAGCKAGSGSQLKENYIDNGKNEPYAAETPLTDMDFSIYTSQYYSDIISPLVDPDYNKRVTLPCDVEYYQSPGDATPVLTLPKGSDVYVLPGTQRISRQSGTAYSAGRIIKKAGDMGNPFL